MNFYSVRDLRTCPRDVWETLSEKHEVIITNNGKPTALMIEIDGENLEDTLFSVRQALAMRAVNKLRLDALNNGTSELSLKEINAEIAEARKEMRE